MGIRSLPSSFWVPLKELTVPQCQYVLSLQGAADKSALLKRAAPVIIRVRASHNSSAVHTGGVQDHIDDGNDEIQHLRKLVFKASARCESWYGKAFQISGTPVTVTTNA